jgi:hypothetical protein
MIENILPNNEEEIVLKSSVIDYLDPINGGVPVLISITLYEFTFQGMYWIHPDGNYFLECEENFLKLWGESDTLSLPFYVELCKDIESILPDKEVIFKEVLGI